MKIKLISVFTLIFSLSCNNNNLVKPSEQNPLLGKWFESFSWTDIYDGGSIYEYESNNYSLIRSSTIEFTENTFEVKILPPRRTIIIEDDTIYVGWANDTLYSGYYELSNDTIMFYRYYSVEPTRLRYWLKNDSLHLSVVGEAVTIGDTSSVIAFPMGSFIWAGAFMKTFGVFEKIE